MKRNPVLIEFNWYKCPKTKAQKLQLLDKNLNTLATLDREDFERMRAMQLDYKNEKDIVAYSNKYKSGFSLTSDFESTVFEIPLAPITKKASLKIG